MFSRFPSELWLFKMLLFSSHFSFFLVIYEKILCFEQKNKFVWVDFLWVEIEGSMFILSHLLTSQIDFLIPQFHSRSNFTSFRRHWRHWRHRKWMVKEKFMDSQFRFCQRKRLSHADYSRERFFFCFFVNSSVFCLSFIHSFLHKNCYFCEIYQQAFMFFLSPLGDFTWVSLKIILCGCTRSDRLIKSLKLFKKKIYNERMTMTFHKMWKIFHQKSLDFTLQLNFHLFIAVHRRKKKILWPVNCS